MRLESNINSIVDYRYMAEGTQTPEVVKPKESNNLIQELTQKFPSKEELLVRAQMPENQQAAQITWRIYLNDATEDPFYSTKLDKYMKQLVRYTEQPVELALRINLLNAMHPVVEELAGNRLLREDVIEYKAKFIEVTGISIDEFNLMFSAASELSRAYIPPPTFAHPAKPEEAPDLKVTEEVLKRLEERRKFRIASRYLKPDPVQDNRDDLLFGINNRADLKALFEYCIEKQLDGSRRLAGVLLSGTDAEGLYRGEYSDKALELKAKVKGEKPNRTLNVLQSKKAA